MKTSLMWNKFKWITSRFFDGYSYCSDIHTLSSPSDKIEFTHLSVKQNNCQVHVFIEIKVLLRIFRWPRKKGERQAKGLKGFRVDYKNDNDLCQVLFTGSNRLSPLRPDKNSSPGGLEPPTFRLTAERANRLRHGDSLPLNATLNWEILLAAVR